MKKKLNIAFVWHMHQPIYKDPFTGEYIMPWVLLHGTKDYYDMAAILDEFPDVHQTINLVPSLIEQIGEYASGSALDRYGTLSRKSPEDLTDEEKVFMLSNFFHANWDNMIRPVPRYWELLRKRGTSSAPDEARAGLRYFNDQDYLDLQVLFNLVWIDPMHVRTDPFFKALYKKGRGFDEKDKSRLLKKQTGIMGLIIPKHKELMEKGIIEVSTTPYYHPILPLLCDSESARMAMPHANLPAERFVHPEDARAQIERGVELYTRTFGAPPVGMWPSEGSVSMEMLPLVARAGFKWMATDEEILSNSLKMPIRRDNSGNCFDTFLYRPYSVESGGERVSMIFRDHVLSDLIGFDYGRMDPNNAANDLVERLNRIYGMVGEPDKHVVSIILDGENAWETYRNDGWDFLTALYSKLSGHPNLKCVTVGEFLASTDRREELPWLFSGSWINHNFKIWIGHHEDNAAWDYIAAARKELVRYEEDVRNTPGYESVKGAIDEAWDVLYAAEGSDWFWWYGEEHSSLNDEQFDRLFRLHIKRIYDLIGKDAPDSLDIPIMAEEKGVRPQVLPTDFIEPVIDGEVTNYFEWLAAGSLKRMYQGAAMHRELEAGGFLDEIAYGFSRKELFFRFDYHQGDDASERSWRMMISFLHPREVRVRITVKEGKAEGKVSVKDPETGKWKDEGAVERIASGSVLEVAVPLEVLDAKTSDEVRFFVNIDAGEKGLERWPVKGFVILDVPSEDFLLENWLV